jgi:hypothetical protein
MDKDSGNYSPLSQNGFLDSTFGQAGVYGLRDRMIYLLIIFTSGIGNERLDQGSPRGLLSTERE